jgi:hypothetical protein
MALKQKIKSRTGPRQRVGPQPGLTPKPKSYRKPLREAELQAEIRQAPTWLQLETYPDEELPTEEGTPQETDVLAADALTFEDMGEDEDGGPDEDMKEEYGEPAWIEDHQGGSLREAEVGPSAAWCNPDIRILGTLSPSPDLTCDVPLAAALHSKRFSTGLERKLIQQKCLHLQQIGRFLIRKICESEAPDLNQLEFERRELIEALKVDKATMARLLDSLRVDLPTLGIIHVKDLLREKVTAKLLLRIIQEELRTMPYTRQQLAQKVAESHPSASTYTPQAVKNIMDTYHPEIPIKAEERRRMYQDKPEECTWLWKDPSTL